LLTLIATPIGNLGDLSPRAKEALIQCDLLLCEDTRHTGQLLHRMEIEPRCLKSLHKFNEAQREEEIVDMLREGKSVCMVSDAGTPGIADPGARLVARCHEEGIRVSIIPGPCAFVSAYALSGSESERVQFLGFVPKGKGERDSLLSEVREYRGVSVVYESPMRIKEFLKAVECIDPDWEVVLVRELTKVFEEVLRKKVKDLIQTLADREIKGECALVFLPVTIQKPSNDELVSHVKTIREEFQCPVKEAIEVVSKRYGVPQKELYRSVLMTKSTLID
jgi:16S rRNA (cytidine1402-2'-O)-methyltransferase